jgi:hypothetical protein
MTGLVGLLLAAGVAQGDYSDFLSLCVAQAGPTGRAVCEQIHLKFFQGDTKHFAPLKPADVGAPVLSVDPRIQFVIFNDPNYVAGVGYCYFAFRKWINPAQVSPDDLGLSASGFAILKEKLPEYQRWLGTREGKACKARVQNESQVEVANLEVSLRDYAALIAVNPLAIVRDKGANAEAVTQEMIRTVNHERVHAYQVLCPAFEKWSRAQWEKLSPAEQNKVKNRYVGHVWSDPVVAGREYTAYQLEADPAQMQPHLGNCKP